MCYNLSFLAVGAGGLGMAMVGSRALRHDAAPRFVSLLRWAVVAALMAMPTALLFGPIAGFHYQIGFGILFYMVWNGEDPTPGCFQIDGHEVLIHPARLALTVVWWCVVLAGVIVFVRALFRLFELWTASRERQSS